MPDDTERLGSSVIPDASVEFSEVVQQGSVFRVVFAQGLLQDLSGLLVERLR